jgi:hypothetical protein
MFAKNTLYVLMGWIALSATANALTNPDPSHISINSLETTVTLTPHGFENAPLSQDSANLQWVLENLPHANIELEEGTFHISTTIEAAGYQGTISGQGKDKTFLVGRGELVDGEYIFPELNEDLRTRFFPSGAPHLLWFHAVEGDVNNWSETELDVTIKDLTIRMDGLGPVLTMDVPLPDGSVLAQPLRTIYCFIVVTSANPILTAAEGDISRVEVTLKNVDMIAQDVSYELDGVPRSNPNALCGIGHIGGFIWVEAPGISGWTLVDRSPLNTDITIKECLFSRFSIEAISVESPFTSNTTSNYNFPTNPAFPPASVTIKDNTFEGVGGAGGLFSQFSTTILLVSPSDAVVTIKNNQFLNSESMGILAINGVAASVPVNNSVLNVVGNTFEMAKTQMSGAAINLLDFSFGSAGILAANIKENSFIGLTGFDLPLVDHLIGAQATFKENSFSGVAASGIRIGDSVSPFPPHNMLPVVGDFAKENDFDNLSAQVANIILGPGSSASTVKVSNASDVVDNGQGNIVIVQ